jgi:hypothetical protein
MKDKIKNKQTKKNNNNKLKQQPKTPIFSPPKPPFPHPKHPFSYEKTPQNTKKEPISPEIRPQTPEKVHRGGANSAVRPVPCLGSFFFFFFWEKWRENDEKWGKMAGKMMKNGGKWGINVFFFWGGV